MEIWKDVENCNGQFSVSNMARFRRNYSVSKLGKVRKLNSVIVPQKTKRGYMKVKLVLNGKRCATSIHRLMALAFIPNPNNFPIVRHLNDIKDDNRLENLAWGTDKDNADDALRNGRRKPKAINHKEKINPFRQVINIKTNEVLRTNELAAILGYSQRKVIKILSGANHNQTDYRYLGKEDLIKQIKPPKKKTERVERIAVFDMQWNLLKTFNYMSDCLLFTGCSRSGIKDFIKGKYNHSKGYKFKKIDSNGNFIEPNVFVSKRKPKILKIKQDVSPTKKVNQFSIDGCFIKQFNSIREASKFVGSDKNTFKNQIRRSLTGYCKGFNWVIID